jgi:hypothetical protein
MIGFNLETMHKKVRKLDQNDKHFFFIGGLAQVLVTNLFTGKVCFSFLHENYTYAFSRGITFQNKSLSEVKHNKY